MPTNISHAPIPVEDLRFDKYKRIKRNWEYSLSKLDEFHNIFSTCLKDDNISVVLAGSFGRLEASSKSDIDFVVLSKTTLSTEEQTSYLDKIRQVVSDIGVAFPNPDGVFSAVVSLEDCLKNIGHNEDNLKSLAQRVLLLLETKAVYNEDLFDHAVNQILDKYLEFIQKEPNKEAIFLINDLIRYFREICVNYQYNFWRQEEKWALRNAKLQHSRVIMYAGTLLVLLNASKYPNKIEYIKQHMHYTPLERIALVYKDNGDLGIDRLLGCYEVFLNKISDPAIRSALAQDYQDRYDSPHYVELKVSSELLRSELTRFILKNRNNWSDTVMEYLFF